MPQEQWQDTLADAAKTDDDNAPWEIDVYLVIQFMLLRRYQWKIYRRQCGG